MHKKVSNISFTSNIRFIDRATYANVLLELKPAYVPEMSDVADVLEVKGNAKNEVIKFCIGAVLKNCNAKRDYICHWFPRSIFENSENRNFASKLKQKVNQTLSGDVKGLVIGGLSKDVRDHHYLSLRMFNVLKRCMASIKRKDFSIFLFQSIKEDTTSFDWPAVSFIYSKHEDTYYVNCQKFRSDIGKDLLTPQEIRDHFDFIDVSPNDSVFVAGKKVPSSFFNKGKKAKTN